MLDHRYSTGSNLNANSALIQNLYSQETAPLRAIHLAINTGLEESKNGAGVEAYIRSVHLARCRKSPHSATAPRLELPRNLKTACSHPSRSNSDFVKLRRADVSLLRPVINIWH